VIADSIKPKIRKQLDTIVSLKWKLTKPVKKPKVTWVEPSFVADVKYRYHIGRSAPAEFVQGADKSLEAAFFL
jgi:hypothetical protein